MVLSWETSSYFLHEGYWSRYDVSCLKAEQFHRTSESFSGCMILSSESLSNLSEMFDDISQQYNTQCGGSAPLIMTFVGNDDVFPSHDVTFNDIVQF